MGKKKDSHSKKKEEYLYGLNAVSEAFKSRKRKIHEVYLVQGRQSARLSEIESAARENNVGVTVKKSTDLEVLSGNNSHQGVVARVAPFQYSDLSDLIKTESGSNGVPFLLMLDGVEDPGNLGALARSALCAGVDGIIIPKDRAAAPTPAASKSSAGALEHLALARVTNLVNTIRELKDAGFWIAGLDADADKSLYETDLTMPLCVVVGGEDRGVRPLVRKQCDYVVSIPQEGPVNSLNASVAGAVVMYEVVRQRLTVDNP